MFKVYLFTALVLCLSCLNSFGQPSISQLTNDRTISFPSPNAASLGKFGFIPVNYSSGMVNVSIPIWDIKEDELNLPIKLIYNNNGLRTAEEASWVGHGWALAANNTITRIVRGVPDFEGSVLMNNNNGKHFEQLGDPSYIDNLTANRISTGLYDGEPDLFSFTCGEYSGKFVMYNNVAIPVPYNGLNVVKVGNNFKIITDKGIIYEFAKRETTTLNDANGVPFSTLPYTSAWLLTSITSSNKIDKIDFFYSAQTETIESASNQTASFIFTGNAPPYNSYCGNQGRRIPVVTKSTVDSWRLEKIQSANTEIIFTPQASDRLDLYGHSRALDQIEIKYRGNTSLIKKFKFSYEYFGSEVDKNIARLKLTSVLEYGSNGERLQPYKFEYNSYGTPSKNGFSMDHWGYYNGSGNDDLIPKIYDWQIYGSANRAPFISAAKAAMLTKIIYPTKGWTTFDYEQNQYLSSEGLKDGPGVRIEKMEDFDGSKSRITRYVYTNPIFFGEPKYGQLYKVNCNYCIPAGPTHCINDLLWQDYASVTGHNTSLFAALSSFALNYQSVKEYKGQYGEYGITEYIYEPNGQYIIDRQMRLKEIILKTQNEVVKRTVNSYTTFQDRIIYAFRPTLSSFNIYTSTFPNMFERDPVDGAILNDYNLDGDDAAYWITSSWSYLNKTVTSEYKNSLPTLSTEVIYRHLSTPVHRYVTDIESKGSDGIVNITKFVYTPDFNTTMSAGSDPFYNSIKRMKELNMNNFVIESQYLRSELGNTKLYSASLALYKAFSGTDNIRLAEIHELKNTTPIDLNSVYISGNSLQYAHLPYYRKVAYDYSSTGRLTSSVTRSEQISYVWSSDNLYPIVKGINISVAELNAAYTAAGSNISTIRDHITIPNAQIFTYMFQPLVGISSVIDPNKRMTTYSYDVFGRLRTVKDDDDKIIQVHEYHYKTSSN